MIESTVNIIQAANIEVGLSTNVDGYLYFDNGETNKPGFRFNSSVSKLQFSHDGNYWVDFTLPIVGGELSGTLSNARVIGFDGKVLTTLVPTDGQVIYFDGNNWNYSQIGGDVTGNITDVKVSKIKGIQLDSTIAPQDGFGYVYNQSQNKWILGEIQTTVTPPETPTTGGDCSGLADNITVIGFNGIPLDLTQVPEDGQIITWTYARNNWHCDNIGGSISGPFYNVQVINLGGYLISSDVPADRDVLLYDSGTNNWTPRAVTFISPYYLDLFSVGGRLSLESGSAYMTDLVTGYIDKTILYWVPIKGGNISLFNGVSWEVYTPGELSINTDTLVAEKIYDVFMYVEVDTPTLIFGPAWTDDFTRSQELTTFSNVKVQTGTNYRYLGTVRTFGTNPVYFQYTSNNISLWNYYNTVRIPANILFGDLVSWSLPYTGAFRVFNNDSTRYVAALIGIKENCIDVNCMGIISSVDSTYAQVSIGIGINSTTVNSGELRSSTSSTGTFKKQIITFYENYINIGYNKIYPLEKKLFYNYNVVDMTGNSSNSSGYCSGMLVNLFG